MAKKENKYKGYDITTQAIHTGTDYDQETGAVPASQEEAKKPVSIGQCAVRQTAMGDTH